MSQHKYASNVVEKCLEYGNTSERELLIEEILGQSEEKDHLLVGLDLVCIINHWYVVQVYDIFFCLII